MTPAARTEAAIVLLDAILAAARGGGAAADVLAQRFFAARRYAGSKDRRAIRALVWKAIRRFGSPPENARAALVAMADDDPALAASFDGSPYGPAPIAADEPRSATGIAPDWIAAALRDAGLDDAAQAALLSRAPLDLRVNALRGEVDAVAAALGGVAIAGLAHGLRLPPDTDIARSEVYESGAVEVQDAGSQWVTLAAGAQAGERVIDLCAGGGGKTLALAAAMADRGDILATDTDRARLSRLMPRAERAGVTIARTRLLDPGREAAALADMAGAADLVLVDAPCSGTGTWRRNPEARWRLTPDRLDRLVTTQARLLALAADCTRPGGRITYIVCSLLDVEGADQVARFLAERDGWRSDLPELGAGRPHGAGLRFHPQQDDTDGFFVARLVRTC